MKQVLIWLAAAALLASCGDSHERTVAQLTQQQEALEAYQGELERAHRQLWPNPAIAKDDSLLVEDATIIARHNQLMAGYQQLLQQYEQGQLSDEQASADAESFQSQHNQLRRQHEALVKLKRK